MSMQPHNTLLCALLVVGCFVDDGDYAAGDSISETDASESTLADDGSSDHESSDETWTDDSDSTTDTWSGSSEDTTEDVTTSDTSTGSSSGSDDCAPVDVEIDGVFEAGESRTIYLDFDDFPGMVGETAELCASFTTANPASIRTITIGGVDGEALSLGPCNAALPPPGPFMTCKPYVEPEGLVEVVIHNMNLDPGSTCQTGPMDDLVLSFGCLS